MIIAKSILLRSPALQRAMCAIGHHWWRKVFWYSHGFKQPGFWCTSNPHVSRRCRFCGKEE